MRRLRHVLEQLLGRRRFELLQLVQQQLLQQLLLQLLELLPQGPRPVRRTLQEEVPWLPQEPRLPQELLLVLL